MTAVKDFAVSYFAMKRDGEFRHGIRILPAINEDEARGAALRWAQENAPFSEGWQVHSVVTTGSFILSKRLDNDPH